MSSTATTPRSSAEADRSSPVTQYSASDRLHDVAVVGMGCRVPGGIQNPEQLWQTLLDQVVASSEIPASRWEPYHRRDSRNPKVLSQTTSRGYFVENIESFDHQFFGISPKEAEQMDPQQRISLEVVWEALEDAGIAPKSLSGSDAAVFWGVNSNDYSRLVLEDLPNIDAWMGIGTAYCGVPNRISYHLNLNGPSVAVDAACASSLAAVHHGAKAIVGGETKVAMVGGVNALCGPGLTRVLDKAGAVSPDGECRSFDENANGYGRAEGVGAVILKNLSQALHEGDHILGVIKGTSVGHNGRTNGIMAPNSDAQQLAARNALHVAEVDPRTVHYVEAHATSTALGDPTEISALAKVYGEGRSANDPCYIGSIKPNIGHLEAGAGVMGFIKAVLTVQKGVLPPQANLQKLNTRINWDESGVKVVQQPTDWPSVAEKRRAAVCSYGYGGTVSHAVIEEFPRFQSISPEQEVLGGTVPGGRILLLSAPQEHRVVTVAESLSSWISQQKDSSQFDLASFCSTMAARRSHHDFRASAIVEDVEGAINALDCLSKRSNDPWISQSRVLPSDLSEDVVWVFSGHGAQWTNMGKELVNNTVFFKAIQPLDGVVHKEIGSSPIAWLQEGDFESSDRVQILTYIMQIGVSAVLNSRGLYPQATLGHSVGEIAASVVAGALTPEEGTLIVTRRAALYRQVMGHGAMALVSQAYEDVRQDLEGNDDVVAAIDSSPSSCVIAGPKEAVVIVSQEYQEQGIKTYTVKTDIAFHSPMLDQLAEPLAAALEGELHPVHSAVKLYSTSLLDPRGQDPRDPSYWVNNMARPVQLTSAVRAALDDGYLRFLEVSSHPLVTHSINETLMDAGIDEYAAIHTLRRNQSAEKSILHAIGQLHCSGVEIDWRAQMPGAWMEEIPPAPWVHRPLRHEPATSTTVDTHDVDKHTLLGQRTAVAGTDMVVYSTTLDNDTKPFPGSHPVFGTEITPAACLINTFLRATGTGTLQNTILRVPVATSGPRTVQVVVHDNQVKLMSRLIRNDQVEESAWVTHCTAAWSSQSAATEETIDITGVTNRLGTRLEDNFTIDYLAKVGVAAMGFPWMVLEHYGSADEMIARVDVAPGSEDLSWDISSWAPFLDAATSIGSTIFFSEPRLRMPAQIHQVDILTAQVPPKVGWVHVERDLGTDYSCHVRILSETGESLARFSSMRFSEIEGTPGASGSISSLVHRVAWPPAMPAEEPISIERVILIASDMAVGETYTKTLPAHMQSVQIPTAGDLVDQFPYLQHDKKTVIVYIPDEGHSLQEVSTAADNSTWQLLEVTKYVVQRSLPTKIFVLTTNAMQGGTPTALAHAPLLGLSRVIASEHPDNFGGLIDGEHRVVPLTTMKYIQGADVVRICDGMPRTARLRALPREHRVDQPSKSLPRPEGTYLIAGGLGALGLAVAEFLVDQGARRLVLISRRCLPPRKAWNLNCGEGVQSAISKIQELERRGVCVHVLALDISVADAAQNLLEELDRLSLPPVLGVVHAAGVLENQLVLESTRDAFNRVLSNKINGALALHDAFPPNTLDFCVFFSSCGQLFGFPGQGAYGSANAFLDTLATHRRDLGDNAVAFQWTVWRGMGLGSDSDFVAAELENKGITDVTRHDAFQAWLYLAQYNADHGVVLRSRVFDDGEPLPTSLLNDIAIRREKGPTDPAAGNTGDAPAAGNGIPSSEPELKDYLDEQIRGCVANVLHLSSTEVDSRVALADLGLDSVMNTSLRQQLQRTLKVNVPPTLTWSYPTVKHLVGWFAEKLAR